MAGRLRRTRSMLRTVVQEMRSQEISFIAGSIAYHAFVSLLPILLLATLAVSAVGGEALSERILALAELYLPRAGQEVVADTVRDASDAVGASLIGVVVLLWGTFKIFRELDAAFSEIYDVGHDESLLSRARDVTVVFTALLVAIFVAVTVGSLFEVPSSVPHAWLFDALVSTAGLVVAFFPMYYVFPDVEVTVGEVVPGVVVAAVGWTSLEWLFRLYVEFSTKQDVYGFVGGLLLLVTWLYVSAFLLLLGGSVNATLAGRTANPAAGPDEELGTEEDRLEVEDVADFEREVAGLVSRARDAELSGTQIRRVLAEQAERVGGDGVEPVHEE